MTISQLSLSFGIPRQTIYNWRNSAPSDWRYKMYVFLTSEEVTPKEVERALTKAPEVASPKNEESLQAQMQRLTSEMAEVKNALSEVTSQGLFGKPQTSQVKPDAKVRVKPRVKSDAKVRVKPRVKSDAKVRV